MGSRDDRFLDDERADARMLQLLARMGEPIQADLPPDIVTRTARRLPSEPPALAARRAARRRKEEKRKKLEKKNKKKIR